MTSKLAANLFSWVQFQTVPTQIIKRSLFRRIGYSTASSEFTIPVDDQSLVLQGTDNIRASKLLHNPDVLCESTEDGVTTVYEAFKRGIKVSENGPCLGTRSKSTGKYEWISYEQVQERVLNVGSGLQQLGILPGTENVIGINTSSRAEFPITWLATSFYGSMFAPIFSNLGTEAVSFIVSQTETSLIVCDTEEKVQFLLNQKSLFPNLKTFILTDEPSKELRAQVNYSGATILSFTELECLGKSFPKDPSPSKEDDIFTICWTSGTTGMPKGVLITHKNIFSSLGGLIKASKPLTFERMTGISFMPPAHIYEMGIELLLLYNGGRIGFFGGNVLKLLDDIRELKPTFLPMVPRILNRVYLKALKDIKSNPIKRRFLNVALRKKTKLLKKGIVTKSTFWDKFIFETVRDEFGGNVTNMVNSAAPLSPEVAVFFRCALGCHLFDVYGQTEVGATTMTIPNEVSGGNVGPPLPSCQVKLQDVPEMGYFAKDGIGEICLQGPTVCKGYFKNPDATKQTIDENGWFHTGDVGKWLSNGALAIVDRKKNLFKMSQGEFISPEKIENAYAQSSNVGQVFVTALSDKDFVVAIVVPDETFFINWCKNKGLGEGSLEELCMKKEVKKRILTHLRKYGDTSGLNSLEQIRNVYLHPKVMTVDNDLMTPTLKIKRNIARKYFEDQIREMYEEGPLC